MSEIHQALETVILLKTSLSCRTTMPHLASMSAHGQRCMHRQPWAPTVAFQSTCTVHASRKSVQAMVLMKEPTWLCGRYICDAVEVSLSVKKQRAIDVKEKHPSHM